MCQGNADAGEVRQQETRSRPTDSTATQTAKSSPEFPNNFRYLSSEWNSPANRRASARAFLDWARARLDRFDPLALGAVGVMAFVGAAGQRPEE
jgi:hypothetical protein